MSTGLGSSDSQSGDFELNLASMIDCFTVLIAFLLASSSFLSIGALDVSVIGASAPQDNPPNSREWIPVFEVSQNGTLEIRNLETHQSIWKSHLQKPLSVEIPGDLTQWDPTHYGPPGKLAVIAVHSKVESRDLVALLGHLKKTFPQVSISELTPR